MKLKTRSKFVILLLILPAINCFAQQNDAPFKQATSLKYTLADELKTAELKKVVVDYNNIVYLLTDKGLYREYPNNTIAKDVSYKPLSKRIPVDICTQEETGYLFYLYAEEYLSYAHAGTKHTAVKNDKFNKIAVSKTGEVLLIGKNSCSLFVNNKSVFTSDLPITNVDNIYTDNRNFYIQNNKVIYCLKENNWHKVHENENITCLAFRNDKIYIGTDNGYYRISKSTGERISELENKLPVNHINKMFFIDDKMWCTTPNGAFVKEVDRYRYFASKRWLNDNNIIDAEYDSTGNLYFLTPDGLNKIEYITQTLAQKAAYFQDNIRKYHMRYGFVCASRLLEPYNISSGLIHDHDNDGLWTSFYLGSQAFRYATTKENIAKQYCWESFEAFERLLSVNPLKGFPSRTFERKGYKVSDPDRWRYSQEPEWEWKGHTSSDEFVAYIFVAALMDKFICQTPEERKRVADFIDQIITHIIDNDFYFVDADGKPTLWARWNPEYVNMYPKHVYDRKLNSTLLIAGLQIAYDLTGKEIYKSTAFKMMNDFGYLENMMVPMNKMRPDKIDYDGITMGDSWNHSDDEMAFLTYWPLYHYAFNDSLKSKYVEIINDHWEIEKPERNALWNIITYGLTGKIDSESTLWHLHEFKLDLISYKVKNSHRNDIEKLPANFREQSTKQLLTPGERTTHRHNANPFKLDGGSEGTSKLAGDEFLLPYWMCRYYGYFSE